MDNLTAITALLAEIAVLIGAITPIVVSVRRVSAGQRCLMRSDMLSIYYHNRDKKVIRQYELENFLLLYEAYKALKGNSFIDKIHEEVMSWDVVT